MDEAGVAFEVDVVELWVAVEAEPFDDQRLELPSKKVGKIECAGRGLGECLKAIAAGKCGIAVRPGEALDPLLLEHLIEGASGAAIRVGDVDLGMGGAGLMDGTAHRVRDQCWPVVQGGGQAAKVEVSKAVGLDEGGDLPGEGAAGDDQCALHRLHSKKGYVRLAIERLLMGRCTTDQPPKACRLKRVLQRAAGYAFLP